jgi:hypothetical protein
MVEEKTIQEIEIEKRVYSEKTSKFLLRGRDKKTKELGILVCLEVKGEPINIGRWLPLE